MDTRPQGYSSVGRASVSKTAPYSRDFSGLGTLSYQDKRKTGQEPVNRQVDWLPHLCPECRGSGEVAGLLGGVFTCGVCGGRGRTLLTLRGTGGQPVNRRIPHG